MASGWTYGEMLRFVAKRQSPGIFFMFFIAKIYVDVIILDIIVDNIVTLQLHVLYNI